MDKVEVHADRLEGVIADTAAIQAVDLLTDEEIELLREIASADPSDLPPLVGAANSDAVRQGMLFQLSDLGFVEGFKVASGKILGCNPTPKAAWAVARHDRRVAEEAARRVEDERRRKADAKRQWLLALAGYAVGLASGVVAPVLASMLKALAQSAGLPTS